MIQTIQNSLQAMQTRAQHAADIGLRAATVMAGLANDAGERWNALQVSAGRSALDTCADLARVSATEPAGAVEPTLGAMRQATGYWRTAAGLMLTSQAECAEAMDGMLAEWIDLTEASAASAGAAGAAYPPLAVSLTAGTGALAIARAMCARWAHWARQFGADSGVDRDLAVSMIAAREAGETRARTPQRKAA